MIHNETGVTFHKLYLEPSSNQESWGEQLLEGGEPKEGDTPVNFNGYGGDECKWDFWLESSENKRYDIRNVDLCAGAHITFTMDDNSTLHWKVTE